VGDWLNIKNYGISWVPPCGNDVVVLGNQLFDKLDRDGNGRTFLGSATNMAAPPGSDTTWLVRNTATLNSSGERHEGQREIESGTVEHLFVF